MIIVCIITLIICLVLHLRLRSGNNEKSKLSNTPAYKDTVMNIGRLEPGRDISKLAAGFYRKKISVFLRILFIGTLISLISEISKGSSGELIDGRYIKRDGYGGNTRYVELIVKDPSSGEKNSINVEVEPKRYSEEELESMLEKIDEMLPKIILSGNLSADHVEERLDFTDSIIGYPFRIEYSPEDPLLLTNEGLVNEERLRELEGYKDGVLTGLKMTFIYEDFIREKSFFLRIFPKKEEEESFKKKLEDSIKSGSEKSIEKDYLSLPAALGPYELDYEEPFTNTSLIIFILTLGAAFLVSKREDEELKNKIKGREEQLEKDYPMLLNKFALFYGAGMTTKGIILKLCKDYEDKRSKKGFEKRYAYEELLKTRGKLEEGLGEIRAYEALAKRMGSNKYRQLINLMEQAVVKGKSDIRKELSVLLERAFSERKNLAKRRSEEAGTKLLMPMFLMLFVVIVIIMVPAFFSFGI